MIRRITKIVFLLACVSSSSHAKGERKPFQIYDFSKGVDTYHDPSTLPEGYVQDSLNVLFDDKAPASKRSGYAVGWSTTTSFAFTGLWTYTDASNTSWQIARSSTQITASNLAGSVVKVATVSASNIVNETNAFGNAYFVDQTQGVYYWNGTSTTFVSGSPRGSIITQFHNRLWVTGAAVPNGNQLYGSKFYDGTTWTTGINATDPVQYSIGLQDNFDNITAEYVYLDTLYIFKHYAVFALYGFDQTNFQISYLTQECGCIDGNSIQTFNGGLKFVSLRGVENFDGYHCTRISDPVKNKVDPAIQVGGFSQQSWIQQNATDWNSGTRFQLSSTISPPSLVLSTGSVSDSTSVDFGSGTFTSTMLSGNTVVLSTNNTNVANNDLSSCVAACETNWDQGGCVSCGTSNTGLNCTLNPRSGSYMLNLGYTSTIDLTATLKTCVSSTTLATTLVPFATNSCSWTSRTLSQAGQAGKRVFISFERGFAAITSDCFISNGGNITFYTASDQTASNYAMNVDDVTDGKSTVSSGNFLSRIFDTGVSSPVATVSISSTSNTEPITFVLRHSTSSSGPFVDLTSNQNTSVTANRYLQYRTTFTLGATDNGQSSLNSASLSWTASSGTFKSQIHNVGTITGWGNFSVSQVLNGGTIAYSVCSSTNSNMGPPTSCTNQTINSQILSSTGTYVQWYSTFTVTATTQIPTLNSGTVQWFTGSVSIPMASTVWDNRYWLSLTTTTADTVNDAVLVLNSRGGWSVFDLRAGAFTQYKNSLYHADSNASGNIYLDNQAYADNGSSINSFIRTRTTSLGSLASDDYMYVVYPSAANTGNCSMSVQYTLDKSTATYSLGSPLLSEFGSVSSVRLPFPVDSSHMDFGQSIDFTIGTNDSSCAWNFYGLEGLFKSRPVQ